MRTEILAALVYPRQWLDKPLWDNVLCFEYHNRGTTGVLSTLPNRLRPVTSRTGQIQRLATRPDVESAGLLTTYPHAR